MFFSIDEKKETEKIIDFLKKIQKKVKKQNVVLGLSGGVDSTTVYYLLTKAYKKENIFVLHLPYDKPSYLIKDILEENPLKKENFIQISISSIVKKIASLVDFSDKKNKKIRLGNIAARVRMILLFDMAKKTQGLVCGTENKSENLLGYFTRFGDAASDIEPIAHLYKTQVYQLAKFLKVPQKVIDAQPSANLWQGQTDEKEFGFSYQEADQVLYLFLEKKYSLNKIKKLGFKNGEKILNFYQKNLFKKSVPYSLI